MHAATSTLLQQVQRMLPVSAPAAEQEELRQLFKVLTSPSIPANTVPTCRLLGPKGESLQLPPAAFYMLSRIVEVLARGDAVTVVPVGKELTTQQAADLLNVSRQYLIRLLDQGTIPFTKTGRHRRLRIEHVLAYKEQRDTERQAALAELVQFTEDCGGYDELKK